MLFNSYQFLFLFLPMTLRGTSCWLALRWPGRGLVGAASLFYGWWDFRYVPLLLGSITFNFWAGNERLPGRVLPPASHGWRTPSRRTSSCSATSSTQTSSSARQPGSAGRISRPLDIVLPLGISFFTFTQIAFLVDAYHGKVTEYRFVHYVLFVTYFPHLIAGPVLHHKEMMPQFGGLQELRATRASTSPSASPSSSSGWSRRSCIADNLAPMRERAVRARATRRRCSQAWGGVLAYTLQLYFDFSGYSDMAIGLSRLFGVRSAAQLQLALQGATTSSSSGGAGT